MSGIVHGKGSQSTSPSTHYNSSPATGPQAHFYANSAPSSLIGLQYQQSPRSRPPVPVFPNSTGSIPQTSMARSASFEGSSFLEDAESDASDLTSSLDMIDYSQYDFAQDTNTNNLYDGGLNLALNFETIHDPALGQTTNPQTVSPKDLMIDSMSAPPSGAFTELTTPGTTFSESPWDHSTNTSPSFGLDHNLENEAENWGSLFPEEIVPEEEGNTAPIPQAIHTASITHVAPQMSRNDSSTDKPSTRSSNQGRHSSTAGVTKRRDKPLPAIHIEDPTDTVAVKRARNTLAARKSREKRMERTEALEHQVQALEQEKEQWRSIALGLGYTE